MIKDNKVEEVNIIYKETENNQLAWIETNHQGIIYLEDQDIISSQIINFHTIWKIQGKTKLQNGLIIEINNFIISL